MSALRVLVVEDSLTVREHLLSAFDGDPGFQVAGECGSGDEAMRFLERHPVDVISLDMVLPGMSGLEVTERVVAAQRTPIVIVSASANRGAVHSTLDALNAGAVDVFDKARIGESPGWASEYKSALRLASRIRVVPRPAPVRTAAGAQPTALQAVALRPAALRTRAERLPRSAAQPPRPPVPAQQRSADGAPRLVVIGASTGGPSAVAAVLGALPADFGLPILVVIHLAPMFAGALADWLATKSPLGVRLAVDGEPLPLPGQTGVVLLAPADRHLAVERGFVRLLDTPERHACRPSVDVLFESVAAEFGSGAVGVLLTGMGRDGAVGLRALRERGAHTICQDEATCAVFGMPREAIGLGAAASVLPLDRVTPELVEVVRQVKARSET